MDSDTTLTTKLDNFDTKVSELRTISEDPNSTETQLDTAKDNLKLAKEDVINHIAGTYDNTTRLILFFKHN